jgi:hypothetical protein
MRNLLVTTVLVSFSIQLLAAKTNQAPPTTTFTIQSVTLSGNNCSLSVRSPDGVTYYATAWAWACGNMRTGDTLTGYVKTKDSLFAPPSTELYFENGFSKKGKMKWSPPFEVSSQAR